MSTGGDPAFESTSCPKKNTGKKCNELNPDYSPELPDRYSELNDNRQITFQYYLEDENSSDRHHTFETSCVDVFGVDNTELQVLTQQNAETNHKLSTPPIDAAGDPPKWDLRTSSSRHSNP